MDIDDRLVIWGEDDPLPQMAGMPELKRFKVDFDFKMDVFLLYRPESLSRQQQDFVETIQQVTDSLHL